MPDPTQYPKCKYHASLPPLLVQDEKEEKALGEGWLDHPDQIATSLAPRRDPSAEDLDRVAEEEALRVITKGKKSAK